MRRFESIACGGEESFEARTEVVRGASEAQKR